MNDDLRDRVNAFGAMELPGQSTMMHMGTIYLVNDLWAEVQRLRKELMLATPSLEARLAKETADAERLRYVDFEGEDGHYR